jgi:hypothetical protein
LDAYRRPRTNSDGPGTGQAFFKFKGPEEEEEEEEEEAREEELSTT